ncbi:hypothetical protein [Oceaniglobus roseus]|uniref:hypothetical protein n=1 Tax=Oceaniglobus roseus TaxID=1737570 RepID=UPI000C7ED2BC|nr:hypothetical protein [Kandeliimicrobium roseum]
MSLRRRTVVFTGLAAALGGAGVWSATRARAAVSIRDAQAVPVEGAPDETLIFAQLAAALGPDRLLSATLVGADEVRIISDGALVLPAGSTPVLAADGAHLRARLRGGLAEGQVLPLTLSFETAGRVTTRATAGAPFRPGGAADLGLLSLGGICTTGPGEPAPRLTLSVTPADGGWHLAVAAEDFTFTSPDRTLGHYPGQGHGHLYLNGLKLQRMYAPEARIGQLPPGDYVASVTLNTNDHRAYVVEDRPVEARVSFAVPSGATHG